MLSDLKTMGPQGKDRSTTGSLECGRNQIDDEKEVMLGYLPGDTAAQGFPTRIVQFGWGRPWMVMS